MSPTLIGWWKVMASTATVTTRPWARRAATTPPAISIWLSTQPPKISPLPFMSAGIGAERITGSPRPGAALFCVIPVLNRLFWLLPPTILRRKHESPHNLKSVSRMNDLFQQGAKRGGDYTAKDIEVLEGLEPVRRRPGMYIGGIDERALHHLFAEVLDNAMDEA